MPDDAHGSRPTDPSTGRLGEPEAAPPHQALPVRPADREAPEPPRLPISAAGAPRPPRGSTAPLRTRRRPRRPSGESAACRRLPPMPDDALKPDAALYETDVALWAEAQTRALAEERRAIWTDPTSPRTSTDWGAPRLRTSPSCRGRTGPPRTSPDHPSRALPPLSAGRRRGDPGISPIMT